MWLGTAESGMALLGEAGLSDAMPGGAGRGKARQGRAELNISPGKARHGWAL